MRFSGSESHEFTLSKGHSEDGPLETTQSHGTFAKSYELARSRGLSRNDSCPLTEWWDWISSHESCKSTQGQGDQAMSRRSLPSRDIYGKSVS